MSGVVGDPGKDWAGRPGWEAGPRTERFDPQELSWGSGLDLKGSRGLDLEFWPPLGLLWGPWSPNLQEHFLLNNTPLAQFSEGEGTYVPVLLAELF